jgi:hypothetical protein
MLIHFFESHTRIRSELTFSFLNYTFSSCFTAFNQHQPWTLVKMFVIMILMLPFIDFFLYISSKKNLINEKHWMMMKKNMTMKRFDFNWLIRQTSFNLYFRKTMTMKRLIFILKIRMKLGFILPSLIRYFLWRYVMIRWWTSLIMSYLQTNYSLKLLIEEEK